MPYNCVPDGVYIIMRRYISMMAHLIDSVFVVSNVHQEHLQSPKIVGVSVASNFRL